MKLKLSGLRCRTLEDHCNLIQGADGYGRLSELTTIQRRYEILRLLTQASKLPLLRACEIGTSYGGTFYLMSKAAKWNATLITIDINSDWQRAVLLHSYGKLGQRVHVIAADSNDPHTLKCVEAMLKGRKLDFLFIDGDHNYQGVSADFACYSPLVRPGGLIAFHDIIPDFKTKFGIDTGNFSGGVPRFWQEIRTRYSSFEIVEDPGQDSFGIGVIPWRK